MTEESTTYQKQAYDYVREQIINLGLKPGEYITDAYIASQLNISRTPVREAFQRLEKEGLLVNEARKGWQVYSLALEDIYEIFELKMAIEGMVVRKAARSTDEALRGELSRALDDMQRAAEANDREAWIQADIDLHNTLFLMADNVRAERIIANINDQWHRLRLGYDEVQGRTKTSISEHVAFITSVLKGEAEAADRYLSAHLTRVRDDLIQLVTKVLLPYTDKGF